ncbi:acyl-CoA synthetase [Zavarzinia compransoris]|uniref:Acyl-CoA synthetase n=1 Tax=Zavarzinia compransoris TaxID=1264899 RepID=A0A317DUD4_9PROT|nr:acyl-CoA synthetase [Zavarzinia compransoris]PWR18297.1 acyl-CoA synthetase [Zavarzinia compransoris]TDP43646.1 fatty-acyl-CoA synthase [Zavarzinia compransoris]
MTMVSGPADILAIERVPLADRRIPATPYDMLVAGAALAPDAPALSFFAAAKDFGRPAVWRHRDLIRDIHRTANMFRRLGIGRQDVVAFVLPNLPETHLTIWGGEAAGIVFAINPLLEAAQIAELLRAGRAKWLVTLAPTPGVDLWQKVVAAAASVPTLDGILSVGMGPYVKGGAGLALRTLARLRPPKATVPVLDFRRTMAREAGGGLNFAPPSGGDISSYFCTGGTTGLPKIARRTHFSESFDAWAMTRFVEGGFAPGKSIFCGLPLFHVNGQLVTGLAPWSRGAHVVMGTPQGYRGEGVLKQFWTLVEHYRLNAFSGVPTVYSALLQVPLDGHDLSSLDLALCGAAPMPAELFRDFQRRTGVRILEGYGLTEGACASACNPPGAAARVGSIGIRYPYQDMKAVVLDEAGRYLRDAAVDEVGVLAIAGPNVFAGYLEPAHNDGIWIDHQGRRWLNTGDLARQDADGYFWLTGRRKELIIRGGHNIDPKVIEEALHGHPAVALAAAIGRPDPHAGEVPVAYVQLKPGAAVRDDELLAFATETIPERAAWPKAVRPIASLPTTGVGKIFKPALAIREIEDVIRREAATAGVTLAALDVVQDTKRGLLARIDAGEGGDALKAILGRYAFATEFTR